ncbi:hypothetical protein ABZ595_28700 [Streptomyces rubradiris]|uniref:hypothetical protein n=1 Tax=Streptomyces rubradiris TaxID=285531 RepID=UPI0033D01090
MRSRFLPRLRLRVEPWPRRVLILTDTPRPACPECEGDGGIGYDYGDPETGEYAGTDWEPCTCWDDTRRWVLLPLPRRPRRTPPGYSAEPPF